MYYNARNFDQSFKQMHSLIVCIYRFLFKIKVIIFILFEFIKFIQ